MILSIVVFIVLPVVFVWLRRLVYTEPPAMTPDELAELAEKYGHLSASTNAFTSMNHKPGLHARMGRGYRHWRYKR